MIFRHVCSAAVLSVFIGLSGCAATPTSFQYATTGYVPAPPVAKLPTLQGSTHTVRPGETLWRIARFYGLDARMLASANRLPDNGVVASGQKLYVPLPPETNRFLWPLRGSASPSHFGGIDVSAESGTLVRASRAGRVAAAASQLSGWGHTVVMDHPDGSVTVYAGMERLVVASGALLRQGMPVGMSGARPVHFEIRNGVKLANTLRLLPQE